MPTPLAKTSATLLIDDQGAVLYQDSGELIGRLPEAPAGAERRAAWTAALAQWLAPGTGIQVLLGHSGLLLQCQEAPYLGPAEQRDVAVRVFAAENSDLLLTSAGALDPDPAALEGGHVLWLAAQPKADLDEWMAAIQGANCVPVYVSPFQRALARGMASLWELPIDRVVLARDSRLMAHLCIFHGQFLALQRSFNLPAEYSESEEVIFEEVSRLLQFFKQKNRQMVFRGIQILGFPELSPAFQNRVQASLRLEPLFLAPDLWPVLQEGLRRERGRKDGLNLLPLDIQEARQRSLFRNLVWAASAGMGLLLLLVGLFLYHQELNLEREVQRSEQLLAAREARSGEEMRIVDQRLPLLRNRLAERRQLQSIARLGSLGLAIFAPPPGIQLEQVAIEESPASSGSHRFEITGLAFTEKAFSMGPLAQYLLALGRDRDLHLEPVAEVSISDRVVAGNEKKVERMAITRFTLKGTAK